MLMVSKPNGEGPLICVQLVNFNGSHDTLACIDGLLSGDNGNVKIVVVDNGSSESDLASLKDMIPSEVHIIESKENLGFGRANNLAWDFVKSDINPEYLLLLNNDTRVPPGFLKPMIKVLIDNPEAFAVSPKIMLEGSDLIDSAGSTFTSIGSAYSVGHGEKDAGQYDGERNVPMITACCMLIRSESLDGTYLFDPNFFMYLEELDLVLRLHNRGGRFLFTSDSVIYHKFSHSIKGNIDDKVMFKQCLEEGNRVRILLKHFPAILLVKNFLPILISFSYWQLRFLRIGGVAWWRKLNQGIMEGLRDGLVSRADESEHRIAAWLPMMESWRVVDMMNRGKRMESRYGWK